jgi:hypothetical protein
MRRLRIGAARPRAATALLAVSLGTACGGSSPTAPADAPLTRVATSAEWAASGPEAEALDPARLTELVQRIRRAEFIVTAAGAQGQFIFAVLRESLVVVVTSNDDDARWVAPVGFLVSHMLPSIREPRR